MQHLEVSGAVRHIYVVRQLRVKESIEFEIASWVGHSIIILILTFIKFGEVPINFNFDAMRTR